MWKNFIVDWSGTVVDDLHYVWESSNDVLRHFDREPMSLEVFRGEFCLPWIHFYEKHLAGIDRKKINQVFWGRMQQAQSKIRLIDGAEGFFRTCHEHHLPVFILSTVDTESFWGQSDRLGMSRYIRQAYVGVEDKRRTIEAILKEHQLDPAETMMVGDMVHDVETARVAGVTACAVLSGFDPEPKLTPSSPDLLMNSLKELDAVVRAQLLQTFRFPVATVGALIFGEREQVLMLRTGKWSRKWGIPGGKIRYGETIEAAVRREIFEEVNLEIEDIRLEMVQDCIRPEEFFREAHFLLLNFTCRAARGEVKLNDEAQEWAWVSLEEARRMDLNQPTRILIAHYAERLERSCESPA